MFDDDDAVRRLKTHEVGMSIDAMSVDELQERIGLLEAEIRRLQEAIEARLRTRSAADSMFKL